MSPVPLAPRRLLAALLLPALAGLAACGGSDDPTSAAAPSSSAAPSEAASPTPSPSPTVDVTLLGIESQSVGLSVAQWSIDHDFAIPADQAEFEEVKLSKPLSEGTKAGYRKVGGKKFEVCLTTYAGSAPAAWAIFESSTGRYTSAPGTPTEDFCP